MAFLDPGTAGVASSSLYTIFFTQFLGLVQCGAQASGYGCYTGNITHDLLFNFLVPHIIIFAFIAMFVSGWTANKGIQTLVGVAVYIVIIQLKTFTFSLYGFIAATTVWWFIALIFVSMFKFMGYRVFNPAKAKEKYQRGLMKSLSKQDRKKLGRFKQRLKEVNDELGNRDKLTSDELEELRKRKHALETEIDKIESER